MLKLLRHQRRAWMESLWSTDCYLDLQSNFGWEGQIIHPSASSLYWSKTVILNLESCGPDLSGPWHISGDPPKMFFTINVVCDEGATRLTYGQKGERRLTKKGRSGLDAPLAHNWRHLIPQHRWSGHSPDAELFQNNPRPICSGSNNTHPVLPTWNSTWNDDRLPGDTEDSSRPLGPGLKIYLPVGLHFLPWTYKSTKFSGVRGTRSTWRR